MNEQRLTEFGEQALEYAHANYIAGSDPHQWNVLYRKKFAELIVKECIQVVDDTITENQEMNIGLVMASAKIVSHFGVEE